MLPILPDELDEYVVHAVATALSRYHDLPHNEQFDVDIAVGELLSGTSQISQRGNNTIHKYLIDNVSNEDFLYQHGYYDSDDIAIPLTSSDEVERSQQECPQETNC